MNELCVAYIHPKHFPGTEGRNVELPVKVSPSPQLTPSFCPVANKQTHQLFYHFLGFSCMTETQRAEGHGELGRGIRGEDECVFSRRPVRE